MKITKKTLFGAIGLLAVAVVTGIAVRLPDTSVSAASDIVVSVTIEGPPIWLEVQDDATGVDPVIRVHVDDPDTSYVVIKVRGRNGNVVYETTVPVTPEDIENGYVDVELPFVEEDIAPGEYLVTGTSYDETDNELGESDQVGLVFEIEPPHTGLFGISGLTLSRPDYIVTGTIVLIISTSIAILLIRRKKTERRR